MDDVWAGFLQKPIDVVKARSHLEALSQLVGHQLFAVADGYDPASLYPLNLVGMLVGNLAAAYDGYTDFFQRAVLLSYSK